MSYGREAERARCFATVETFTNIGAIWKDRSTTAEHKDEHLSVPHHVQSMACLPTYADSLNTRASIPFNCTEHYCTIPQVEDLHMISLSMTS